MNNKTSSIIQRFWNYCNVLRDDGVGYSDYVEQLTYLLFLKMDTEKTKPPISQNSEIPIDLDWESLLLQADSNLDNHYRQILETLAKKGGLLGIIFMESQNKIHDPVKLAAAHPAVELRGMLRAAALVVLVCRTVTKHVAL